MDLNQGKFRRKLEKWIQPLYLRFKEADPIAVSLSILPLGLITAIALHLAPVVNWFYWLICVLLLGRIVLGMISETIVTVEYKGDGTKLLINALSIEGADILIMLGVIFSGHYWFVGILALAVCWALSFTSLAGYMAGTGKSTGGLVGTSPRMVALLFFAFLQFFSARYDWPLDFIYIFLWWVVAGGLVTVGMRLGVRG